MKKYGIDIDHVVFESDYIELKKYPVVKLIKSTEYPRLVKLTANDKLKIIKTNFEKGLQKTRYFENL